VIAMFEIPARSLQIWAWAPRFLWFGFMVAAALLAARWTTELVSPRPVAALPAVAAMLSPISVDDALRVFDKGGGLAPRADDLELTGLYVKRGNKGFATFQSSQGPRLVLVGEEIQPGLRLVAVATDRVTLRGNGSEWQLEMKSGPGSAKAPPSPTAPRK
jgi:hypothetical protein